MKLCSRLKASELRALKGGPAWALALELPMLVRLAAGRLPLDARRAQCCVIRVRGSSLLKIIQLLQALLACMYCKATDRIAGTLQTMESADQLSCCSKCSSFQPHAM
jgi:hypothetical protein